MKTTNRFGIFVLATLGAAFFSGCVAGDFEDQDMMVEEGDGQVDEVSDEGTVGESTQALTLAPCRSDVVADYRQNGLGLRCPSIAPTIKPPPSPPPPQPDE